MSNATRQQIGDVLEDFCLPRLGGGELSLRTALADRQAAVVVFWSGVCSHCTRYDRYLNDFDDHHGQVALLAVACRQGETADQLRAAAARRGLRFPILHDANRELAHRWQVSQTPRVFLLDPRQHLRYRGAIDNFKYPHDPAYQAYLEEALADLLAGRSITRSEAPSFGCAIESVYYQLPKP